MNEHLINQLQKIISNKEKASENEIIHLVNQLLTKHASIKDPTSISDLSQEVVNQITDKSFQYPILKTGLKNLDEITNFNLGDLVVIGARPSMGKTQLIVNLCSHLSTDFPVLYFSFDLSERLISSRFLALASGIGFDKIAQHQLTDTEIETLKETINTLKQHKIFINDMGAQSISAIKAQCKKYIEEHNIKVLVIDYLQMMSSRNHKYNRELEMSYMVRELKNMARDFNICVIAASQLSRAVEVRGGAKKPNLSDLRDSGAIEQDADKVFFLYRPEYYGLTVDEDGNDTLGNVELILTKNRNGKTGTAHLKIDENFIKFQDDNNEKEHFNFAQKRLSDFFK